jgi:hypothetical protein
MPPLEVSTERHLPSKRAAKPMVSPKSAKPRLRLHESHTAEEYALRDSTCCDRKSEHAADGARFLANPHVIR